MPYNLQIYQHSWEQLAQKQVIDTGDRLCRSIPLQVFKTISSTNQKLWELIDLQEPMPLAAIALQQTAGKGQWGKTWLSNSGGLYLSVAISPNLLLTNHSHLIMATAWGIATVLRSYGLPVLLKWSNDLILNQRKLGGIKIETRTQQEKISHAVIGVGINWLNPVPQVGINLKSYYQQTPEKSISSLEELTAITTYGILAGYQYYLTVGIEQLVNKYLAILGNLGQEVVIDGHRGEVTGITTRGELKVRWRSPGATTEVCFAPGQISLGY